MEGRLNVQSRDDESVIPLFRPEAAGDSKRWLGELNLAHPVPVLRIVLIVLGALLLMAVYLGWMALNQYSEVEGELVWAGGTVAVSAPKDAIVSAMAGPEGQLVRKGERLVELRYENFAADGDVTEQQRELLLAKRELLADDLHLNERKLGEAQRRYRTLLGSLSIQRSRQQEGVTLSEKRAVLAADNSRRIDLLAADRLVSQIERNRSETELIQARQAEVEARRNLDSTEQQIADESAALASIRSELETSRLQTQREINDIDMSVSRNSAESGSMLVSPIDGIVAARLFEVGQAVKSGASLISVVPAGTPIEAHLLVPAAVLADMDTSAEVPLACDAYPYQKYGWLRGRIQSVSLAPVTSQGEPPMYRLVMRIDSLPEGASGRPVNISAGMAVTARLKRPSAVFAPEVVQRIKALVIR